MDSSAWIVFGTAALLLRAGFAIYLCGISRAKDAGASVFRAIAEAAVGILAFWAFGAAILSGSWQMLFGGAVAGGVSGITDGDVGNAIFFPAAISLIASGIVTAATLERSRPIVWIAGAILMPGIITPLAWHWAWSQTFAHWGFFDLAGASFIHFAAGVAAAVAAVAVGARSGKYNRDGSTNAVFGHNVPLASIGLLLMLTVWPACVGGFERMGISWEGKGILLGIGPLYFNTILCAAAAVVASMLYSHFRHSKVDVYIIYAGLLGGLVSISAGADLFSTPFAVLTGAVAGVIVPYAAVYLDLVWKIDDPAGVIAAHGVGGIWGALAAALFARASFAGHLHHLLGQCAGLALIGLLSLVLSAIVFGGLRMMVGIRSTEADETDGLDLAEHDLNAYPDFQQTTIKSYHLREM
jgi:Amt family ammonium transporter